MLGNARFGSILRRRTLVTRTNDFAQAIYLAEFPGSESADAVPVRVTRRMDVFLPHGPDSDSTLLRDSGRRRVSAIRRNSARIVTLGRGLGGTLWTAASAFRRTTGGSRGDRVVRLDATKWKLLG